LVQRVRPAVILIEGPSDFNDRFDELYLPHQLPLAIYSYLKLADGTRWSAFYPFCNFSPEWQALQAAREIGIPARFIDLPWSSLVSQAAAPEAIPAQRYADAELRQGDYIRALCQKLGVADFDAAWDTLFEIDPDLDLAEFMLRCHHFCYQLRDTDRAIPAEHIRREAFMAAQIRQATAEFKGGPALVVTGGFHSHALYSRLLAEEPAVSGAASEEAGLEKTSDEPAFEDSGIALTPYSYERLDSLTGYEAGMPHPGFYDQVWQSLQKGQAGQIHRHLLAEVVRLLRKQGQKVSSADLIAVELMAQGLAGLRSHRRVWRTDLVDGIIGALVKEELEQGLRHPFLEAVYQALRGTERGRLAPGVGLPPFVHDLRQLQQQYDLEPEHAEKIIHLELAGPSELARSQLLHRLRSLDIPGYRLTGGSDFVGRADLATVWEEWRLQWSPEYEAGAIEAAIYGPTVREAAAARLLEQARRMAQPSAEQGSLLLLEACLMGLGETVNDFYARLVELVRQDGSFASVSTALGHLLYLYHYDEVLQTTGLHEIGGLLQETFTRGLWLLEGLGQPEGQDRALLRGVGRLLETFERAARQLALDRDQFVGVIGRVAASPRAGALLRGAATGVLWLLGQAGSEQVAASLRYFADPDHLGDFLTGLFFLAREVVQRQPQLAESLDELVEGYDDEQFLEALPALRLAFSYFSPREKDYLARTILKTLDRTAEPALPDLEVNLETAEAVLAFETRLFKSVKTYGLFRPGSPEASEGEVNR
jgi:hypothetical protein